MASNLQYANAITPTPKNEWLQMADDERLMLIKNTLALNPSATNKILVATAAKRDGQVIFTFLEPIGADRRGTVLLDIEEFLKEAIEPSITVWLEPLGDRNTLRNLRGIEMKS